MERERERDRESLIEVFGKRPTRMTLLADSLNRIKLNQTAQILEAGCSFGDGIAYACNQTGATGHAVDMEKEYIKTAQVRHQDINFKCASVYELPYDQNKFDLVFSQAAFSLLKEKENAIKEYHRVLNKEGFVIINDFVIKTAVKEMVKEEMNFIPCFNSIGTIKEYINYFERNGFTTILAEDKYSEIISTTLYLSKVYKCTPMEMASIFASILGKDEKSEEKSQCFFRNAKVSYAQLIFQKNK